MGNGGAAIRVSGLRKSYGSHEAVRGIDFEIGAGEVFGLLGPNGAGKTTTIEILEGYRDRDAGDVEVLGEDPAHAPKEWRERLGVVLQSSSLYPNLTVGESLEVFGGYYRPRDAGSSTSSACRQGGPAAGRSQAGRSAGSTWGSPGGPRARLPTADHRFDPGARAA
jgi:ABC-2 type transport system ATP-binding protein